MQLLYALGRKENVIDRVQRAAQSGAPLVLFLDYDGTLVPIRNAPPLARLSPRTKLILRRLLGHSNMSVTLVTGRSLEDIKKLVSFQKLLLATNHGFQISRGKKNWIHPQAVKVRPVFAEISLKLATALNPILGAFVEDKRYTLTVHYRRVKPSQVPHVKRIFDNVIKSFRGRVRITGGKKVFEVRPNVTWGKGHAVLRILESLNAKTKPLVFYIGDDGTDEDAFRVVRGRGITIRVGKSRRTRAAYYVRSQKEVVKLLEMIENVLMKT